MSLYLLGATSWLPAPSLEDVRTGQLVVGKGMKGDAVTYIQALTGAKVDKGAGMFGDDTEKAVKAFQTAHGLEPTGVVTKSVMIALDALAGGTAGIAPVTQQFAADVQPEKEGSPSKGSHKDRVAITTIEDSARSRISLALPLLGGLALGGGMVGVIWDAHRILGALLGGLAGAGAGYALYTVTEKKEKLNA